MALLGFTLPPDSGEKLSLGKTSVNFDIYIFFLIARSMAIRLGC
jgi:hypothetical protein